MSWDELDTRVRQEVSKRLDLALCGLGLQPGRNGLRATTAAEGEFFFSTDEIPKRVRLLQAHLPHEAADIVAEANEIRDHRFRLLGYRDLRYGTEIDWHLDAVHGLRSPLIPWFKINFLDFSQVGDHKVTWELNRHQHLVTLAKAWLLTRDEAYVREILAQWYSWQRANPYPMGANWASSLEMAFRSMSWIWMHHLLAECPIIPASFQEDFLSALALHGRQIERYLSTYFSPNTHLLGEAVALFFIGTLYPQISAGGKWKKTGWRIAQQEALRQVRPDGVYFEQTLYYHVYALDFFLHARLLASRNSLEIPAEFDVVLRKMLAVVQALAQAGPPDGFGDDDGGRVFNPRRNRAENMTDPLVTGAALFHDQGMRASATLTEEAVWLFGQQALSWNRQDSNSSGVLKSQSFPDGGLYIAASSELTQQMVIDAGPQGTGRCGHGHADALSVKLSFCDRPWLVDAGTFCYIGSGDERSTFRGTRAHNTLSVDGLDQAVPRGPFAWSSLPKTRVDSWIAAPAVTLFEGSHSGYERLPQPVRHRRFVFHIHDGFWLVRDLAEGSGSHFLETSWHFAPDLEVSAQRKAFVAASSPSRSANPGGLSHLMLVPVAESQWKSELLSEYVSPVYGAEVSAHVLRCSALVSLPAEHATLLIPSNAELAAGEFKRNDGTPKAAGGPEAVYQYQTGNSVHFMIFRTSQATKWNFGPWTSDARFLYFRVKDRRVGKLLFCDGSFAQFRGEFLISHDANLQWLEWMNREGSHRVASSDEAAAHSFSEAALASEIVI